MSTQMVTQLVDDCFHNMIGSCEEEFARDGGVHPDDAHEYMRKHEWYLWGYMDALEDCTFTGEVDFNCMKTYYRKRFQMLYKSWY